MQKINLEFHPEPTDQASSVLCRHLVKISISTITDPNYPPTLSATFNSNTNDIQNSADKLRSDAQCAIATGEEPNYHHKTTNEGKTIHLAGNLESAITKLCDYLILCEPQAKMIFSNPTAKELIQKSRCWEVDFSGKLCKKPLNTSTTKQTQFFTQSPCRVDHKTESSSTHQKPTHNILG